MTYFFCRYNQEESLNARTILGCLIRQCLNVETLPKPIQTQLEALVKDILPDADDLYPLFEAVVALSFPRVHFIVIDGMDECLPTDRNLVLGTLRKLLHSSQTSVKVFLASREEMSSEVASNFRPYYHRSMNCPEVRMDITQYIEGEIRSTLNNPSVVQSSELILDIRKTLEEGAEGMSVYQKYFSSLIYLHLQVSLGEVYVARDMQPDLRRRYSKNN